MQLSVEECRRRAEDASFGVLGTVDPDHGVHLVPVVFVIQGDDVAIPVDTVKPKSSTRLRRVANLRAHPRASLLIDHRDLDWDALWWVRLELDFVGTKAPTARWRSAFSDRYPQYRPKGAIDSLLLLTIGSSHGWAAT